MRLKFIDKEKAGNLHSGLEYYACGLVISDHTKEGGLGNLSGKDYSVGYIDPWGQYQSEWRCVEEVEVSPIDDDDAEWLDSCFKNAIGY